MEHRLPPVTPFPAAVPRAASEVVIKVDLDERAFLFPQHKALTHLNLHVVKPNLVRVEAGFGFNQSRASPVLFDLAVDECNEFSKRLVDAVFRARSTEIVTRNLSLTLTVAANGYILNFSEQDRVVELYLGTASIWRVCNGFARAVDLLSPISSN